MTATPMPQRAGRIIAMTVVAMLFGGCATPPPAEPQDGGPSVPPPELAYIPDPVPRIEPRSAYGNKTPYHVLGKTYHVMPDPERYKEYGKASWYGSKFQGRPTSSGERYDMYKLTAAHRSLPIPSYVRVTNLDNQKSAIVRVNDRGPFHNERLIDLSYAGAVKLGFVNNGTARVMVELVDGTDDLTNVAANEPKVAPPSPPGESLSVVTTVPAEPAVDSPTRLFLQAGAFSNPAGAERLRRALTAIVGEGVHVHRNARDPLYRVRIGPIAQLSEATRLQGLIVTASYAKPLIVRE
jgi:rare lipoprotein A